MARTVHVHRRQQRRAILMAEARALAPLDHAPDPDDGDLDGEIMDCHYGLDAEEPPAEPDSAPGR